jgi:hypothetical protein
MNLEKLINQIFLIYILHSAPCSIKIINYVKHNNTDITYIHKPIL